MSKSVSWMRMGAAPVMANSAAGHRREKSDLARARDRCVRLDMRVVDRGADYLRLLERVGIRLTAAGQPGDQLIDRAHRGRRLDGLLRLADPFAHPGEVLHLHPSSSLM